MIARAKALSTAGFVAVSLAAATASGGAPASPLLKCKATSQCLLLAKRAICEVLLLFLLQKRGGQPGRLIAMQEDPHLDLIAPPPNTGFRCARPRVGKHRI